MKKLITTIVFSICIIISAIAGKDSTRSEFPFTFKVGLIKVNELGTGVFYNISRSYKIGLEGGYIFPYKNHFTRSDATVTDIFQFVLGNTFLSQGYSVRPVFIVNKKGSDNFYSFEAEYKSTRFLVDLTAMNISGDEVYTLYLNSIGIGSRYYIKLEKGIYGNFGGGFNYHENLRQYKFEGGESYDIGNTPSNRRTIHKFVAPYFTFGLSCFF